MTEGARLPLVTTLRSLEVAARHVLLRSVWVELHHLWLSFANVVFALVSVFGSSAPAQPWGLLPLLLLSVFCALLSFTSSSSLFLLADVGSSAC